MNLSFYRRCFEAAFPARLEIPGMAKMQITVTDAATKNNLWRA